MVDSIIYNYLSSPVVVDAVLGTLFHKDVQNVSQSLLKRLLSIYAESMNSEEASRSQMLKVMYSILALVNEKKTTSTEILVNVINQTPTLQALLHRIDEIKKNNLVTAIESRIDSCYEVIRIYQLMKAVQNIRSTLESFEHSTISTSQVLEDMMRSIYSESNKVVMDLESETCNNSTLSIDSIIPELCKLQESIQKEYILPSTLLFETYGIGSSKRLTLFASPTNHGKTTMLSALAGKNILKLITSKPQLELLKEIHNADTMTILYVTLEEADTSISSRLLCSLLDISKEDLKIIDPWSMGNKVRALSSQPCSNNVKLSIHYMPPGSTAVDIEIIIDKLNRQSTPVAALYVDYLDKLNSCTLKSDVYRLTLMSVASELRSLALKYSIPVITATQLNRESLRNVRSLDLDVVSEAYAKTWEADIVALFRQTQAEDDKNNMFLEFCIPKSRFSKRLTEPVYIPVNFSNNTIDEEYTKNIQQYMKSQLQNGYSTALDILSSGTFAL